MTSTLKPMAFSNRLPLVQFEFLKKKRKGLVLVSFLLVFIVMGGTLAMVHQNYQTLPEKGLKVIEMQQQALLTTRTNMQMNHVQHQAEIEMRKKMDEEAGKEDVDYQENVFLEIVATVEEQYEKLEDLKQQVNSPEFPRLYQEYGEAIWGGSYKDMDPATWTMTTMASDEQQEILKERQIIPWPLGNQWVSRYDAPDQAETPEFAEVAERLEDYNMKYDTSSLFASYRFLEWNLPLVLFLVFIIVLWTALSEERRPQFTLQFLVTKTIPVRSVYVAKWLFNLLIAYGILAICGGAVFLIATLVGGFGHPDYPIPVYSPERMGQNDFMSVINNGYFHFENLSTLLVHGLILLVAQVFFLNSLFTFIGKWMKNHAATVMVTLVVVIAGYITGQNYVELTGAYNPFIYLNTWSVVDGWTLVQTDNVRAHVWTGSMMLIGCGAVLFITGFFVKRKVTS